MNRYVLIENHWDYTEHVFKSNNLCKINNFVKKEYCKLNDDTIYDICYYDNKTEKIYKAIFQEIKCKNTMIHVFRWEEF